ncbi:hypothetical protein GOBAR_AA30826 [Gossypium barbadense]|uniref:Uncharacterized protein n=1 Tax=Gossypium barbadense TaxID=3634 RepID=A0A2P5WFH2_GOSBA|nr:hypothetical protein GOBAR_AA30826 [Gossypium barbadense]
MVETAEETGIQGRIINLSSVIHSWVKRDCFSFTQMLNPNNYNATRAYAQSELANILHAKEVARQLKARNAKVTINAVHPGIGLIENLTILTLFNDRNVNGKDGRNSRGNRHPRKNHKPVFSNSQLGQKGLFQLHPNA